MQKTILFLSCLLAATAQAAPNFPGLRTQMGDWDTVCDNTGTCRAAGYQAGYEAQAISLLLVRDAGADAAVSGEIAVTDLNWDDKAPQPLKGSLYLPKESDKAKFGAVQTGLQLENQPITIQPEAE